MIQARNAAATKGVIAPGETFTQNAFCQRIGCSRMTLATWKKNGLETVKIGGKIFVRSIDFDNFLNKQASGAASIDSP